MHFFPTWGFVRKLPQKPRLFPAKTQKLEKLLLNNTRVIIHNVDNSCG
ncbi:Hypothetical protein CulFRC11_0022 [Corynebacterium ramonii]|uniref:Uncharacterized protein n=1 Tax=Corynebacterium ramonii TaxID=3026968 RepID=A0ABN4EEW8_9CORY|nr:Hypothetical protein CulFRC11_0022 [Corynebacterium ramonii FRC0011]